MWIGRSEPKHLLAKHDVTGKEVGSWFEGHLDIPLKPVTWEIAKEASSPSEMLNALRVNVGPAPINRRTQPARTAFV